MQRQLLTAGIALAISAGASHAQTTRPDGDAPRRAATAPLPDIQRFPLPVSRPEVPREVAQQALPLERRPEWVAAPDEQLVQLGLSTDRHARVHHQRADGTRWARGRDYKATADAGGFAFIPFLGSDAPQNYPVRFRLASVERGGESLPLNGEAAVSRIGDRLVLDRGGVEVRYDLYTEHAEQSFALALPGGDGDLVLTLEVTTDLELEAVGEGHRFSNERGGVTYGAAVVLDADGRRAEVVTRRRGDDLELVVSDSFLDAAVGPIVVDPVLATFVVDSFSADLLYPDLAYDRASDSYCVVYEERFSAGDVDVYSQFIHAVSQAVTMGAYVDSTSTSWIAPRIAIQRHGRRYLVVAEAPSIIVSGSSDIVARFRNASDGTFDPAFVLKGATTSYACVNPDVGGEAIDVASSYFCVAYNRDYGTDLDVSAIIVDAAGSWVGSEVSLASVVSHDEGAPAVSKSTGDVGGVTRYVVAWPVQLLNDGSARVDRALLSFDGTNVLGPVPVTANVPAETFFDVEVSSLCARTHPSTFDQYHLVTWDDGSSIFTDAFVALCSGTTVHSIEELQIYEHGPRASNDDDLVVGTLADTFILGYRSGAGLLVTAAQPVGDRLGLIDRRLAIDSTPPVQESLTVATPFSGGAPFSEGLFTWSADNGGGDWDILGATYEVGAAPDAAGTQYCYGVANSTGDRGFIQAIGDRSTGSLQELRVSGLPQNSFGFYLASMTPGLTPTAGTSVGTLCVGGDIGRFAIYNSGTSGTASTPVNPAMIAQPTGPVPAFSGQTWRFQSWHRDSVSGSATSNFTNAVALPFL